MTRTVRVDIDGLNLILGGGVPVLKRHPEFAGESATLLVRGPPGAGKTVLGVQLAGSIARNVDAGVVHDVAYACVELLPSELEAQHAGIKRPEVNERVVVAPFVAGPRAATECRIFAEMLDIGKDGEEVDKLGEALEHVLAAIRERGGAPKVLVIDSLSDGYHLGSFVPRELADALCKMAADELPPDELPPDELAPDEQPLRDIVLSFGSVPTPPDKGSVLPRDATALEVIPLGTLSAPDDLVSRALLGVSRTWSRGISPGRVFIGDCRRVREAWAMETIRAPFSVLLDVFRRASIPVILLDSRQPSGSSPWLHFVNIAVRALPSNPSVSYINDGFPGEMKIVLPSAPWHPGGVANDLFFSL